MLRAKPDWLKVLFPWEQRSLVVNGNIEVRGGSPKAEAEGAEK